MCSEFRLWMCGGKVFHGLGAEQLNDEAYAGFQHGI